MIIKRMEFKNVRSYKEANIEFPMGKTMFEGDIGSGKSTILMAIEFALFGLGSETGGSLLSNKEKEGAVKLAFEMDGKEYEISRGLVRKGKGVQQTPGRVRTPEGDLELSPRELKEKILEILTFNEAPDPKAQSRVYRYAVYTPQEEMKSILTMPSDDRLQILRRAFGVEDYRTATGNSELVAREIKGRIRELRGEAAGAEELRGAVRGLEDGVREEKGEIQRTKAGEERAAVELGRLKEEKERLRGEEVRAGGIARELQSQERRVKQLRDLELGLVGDEKRIAGKLAGLSEEREKGTSPSMTADELETRVTELEGKAGKLAILRDRAARRSDEYRSMVEKGVCPVCEQEIDPGEFSRKIGEKTSEAGHLETEGEEIAKDLAEAKAGLQLRRKHDLDEERRKAREDGAREAQTDLERIREKLNGTQGELSAAEEELKGTRASFEGMAGLTERLEKLGEELRRAEEVHRMLQNSLAGLRARLEEKEKALAMERGRLAKAEAAEGKARALEEYRLWVEDYFVPTVGEIERTVMGNLRHDFDSSFRRWFSMLVGDERKEAWIDESFTPVVSDEGYEQETEFLSGGERTSVALAYRLALNTLVQRVSTGLKSNILILDEPTDGFSREQLGSVREILDEIACPQVIFVSHEKELESFADQIFRVKKEGGMSKVVLGG